MAPPPFATAYAGSDSLTTTALHPPQRRNPDHPPYAEMVQAALLSLADPRGSADSSISRYIVSAYPGIPPGHPKLLPYYLRKLVASGELSVPSPGRYLLPAGPPNAPPQPPVPRPRLLIRLRRVPGAGDGSGENAVRWCHASNAMPAKESVHPMQAKKAPITRPPESAATEHGLKLSSTNNKETPMTHSEHDKEPPLLVPLSTLSAAMAPRVTGNLESEGHGLKLSLANNTVVEQFLLPVSSGRKGQPPAPTYLHPKPHVVCALPAMRQSRTQEVEHGKEPPPPVSANLLSKASVAPTVSGNLQIEKHGVRLSSGDVVLERPLLPVSAGRKGRPPAPAYLHPGSYVIALPAVRQTRRLDVERDKEPPPTPSVSANSLSKASVTQLEEHGMKAASADNVVEPSSVHPKPYVVCALSATRHTRSKKITQVVKHDKKPPPASPNWLSAAAVTPIVMGNLQFEEHGLTLSSVDGVVESSSVHGSSDGKEGPLAPACIHRKPYVVCALPATRQTRSKMMAQVAKHNKEPPPVSSNPLSAAAVTPTVMGNLQFEEHCFKLSSADGVIEPSSRSVSLEGKGEPLAPDTADSGLYVEGALPAPKQDELKELSPDRQIRSKPMTEDAQHDKETLPAPYVSPNLLSAAAAVPTVLRNSQFEEHGLKLPSVEAVGHSSLPSSSDRKGETLAPACLHPEPCVVCALPATRQTRSKSMRQDAMPDKEPPPSPPVAANLSSTTAVAPIVSGDLECEEPGLKLSTVDAVVEQSPLSFSSERKGEPLAPPLVHPTPYVECSLPALRRDGSKESSPFRQTWSESMAQDLDSHPLVSEFDKEPPATTPIPMKLQSEPDPMSPSLDLALEKLSSPASDKKKGLSSTGRTPKARHRRLWYEQ